MSKTIDERVVSMKFDNSQFERGAKETMSTLQKLESSLNLKGAANGLKTVMQSIKDLRSAPIEGLTNAIADATHNFSAFERIATGALYRIGAQAVDLSERLVKSLTIEQLAQGWDKYADKTSSVQTIMAATAKDFEDTGEQMEFVNAQLEKLNWFTDETSYNFLDMVNNIGKFTSNSIDLETSVEAMQGIANWAAISGANASEASRAMYNLSQAISVGSVKLMDWRSIENANMATAEFKEMAIQTAVALGKLKKAGKDTWKTLEGNEVSVRNFNEALSDGWFSSEVLMKTLSKYGEFSSVLNSAMDDLGDAYDTTSELLKDIDAYEKQVLDDGSEVIEGINIDEIAEETGRSAEEIIEWFDKLSASEYELGRKSFKAAQEAKTFQEAIDATKDAVSTGWMNTFEIIFGNYEQAKELWTDLANELWEVFASGGEARNEMLKEWASFGGREDLFEGIAKTWENIKEIIEAVTKAFREVFPVKEIVKRDQQIYTLFHTISNGADILLNISKGLKEFSESFSKALHDGEEGNTIFDKLVRTFRGIFSILDVGKKIIVSVFNAIKPDTNLILEAGKNLLDLTANIGDAIYEFDKNFNPEKSFKKILDVIKIIADFFTKTLRDFVNFGVELKQWGTSVEGIFASIFDTILLNPIKRFSTAIGKIFGKEGDELNKFTSKFTTPLTKIRDAIYNFIQNLKSMDGFKFKMPDFSELFSFGKKIETSVNPLQKALDIAKAFGNGLATVFKGIWTVISPIAEAIGNIIKSLYDMVMEFLSTASLEDVLDAIHTSVLIGLGASLTKVSMAFEGIDPGFGIPDLFEGIVKLGEELKDNPLGAIVEGVQQIFGLAGEDNAPNPEVFKTLATSIAILAGSMLVLALIPSDKLASSIGAITGMFVELMATMKFIDKQLSGGKKALAIGVSIGIIAGAMVQMGIALQIMSAMDWERVAKGLINFGFSMGIIVTAFKALKGDELTKTSASILIVSMAMTQMGIALQIMSAMNWERVGKGLLNFAGAMASIILTFKLLPNDSLIKTAGAIWIVSNAMVQMGIALQIMSAMSWERLAKSLAAFAGSMIIVIKAFNSMSPEKLIETAGAIWIMSSAMIQMGLALQLMGAMKGEAVAKSLIAFGGAMIIIVKAFNDMDNNQLLKTAAAMWIVGQAMIGIGAALQIMGAMSFGSVLKSLAALGGAMAILVVALENINALDGVKVAGALLLISVALESLGLAMLLLGSIGLDKVLVSLAAMAGVLTVLGIAGALLGPFTGSIMLLGTALLAAGAGMLMFGTGLAAMAGALMLIATMGTVAVTNFLAILELLIVGGIKILQHSAKTLAEFIVSLVDDLLIMLRGTIPTLVETFLIMIDEVLESLVNHGPDILKNVIFLLNEIFTQINAYLPTLIDQLSDFIIAIIDGLTKNLPKIVISVMNFLGALLESIVEAINNLDTDIILNAIKAVQAMALVMLALSKLTVLVEPAAAGALAFGAIAVELGAILAALGAIRQIPGLGWLIDEGGDFLNSIGTAIGKFIGGIGKGITASFPEIGRNLSLFMEEAESFIKIAKTIDDSVYNGVKNLIDAMLLATSGSILTRIKGFLTGDSDFVKFGDKLRAFGQSFKAFANEVEGVDSDQVNGCIDATLALVRMAQQIPNEGGLVSLITGDNSLGDFADELADFAPSFKAFADNVKDVDVTQVKGAAEATICLAKMAHEIPNEGGLVSLITGENSLQRFGLELLSYGYNLKGFSDSIKGIRVKAIKDSASATIQLIEMSKEIPNTGGLVSLITGDNSLGRFGVELALYGKELKRFSNNIKGIMSNDFTGAIDATEQLIDMAKEIPNVGGIATILTGDNSIAEFGAQLALFGPHLARFSESIKYVSSNKIKTAAEATKELVVMTKDLPATGGLASLITGKGRLSKYGSELEKFGSSLSIFASDTEGISYETIAGAVKATQELVTLEIPKSGGIVSIFKGKVNLGEFGNQLIAFAPGLKQFAAETEGINQENVEAGAKAAAALLSINFPKVGGIKSWFTGDIKLGDFGTEIGEFAVGLVKFSKEISTTTFDETKMTAAANCSSALVGIANSIPPTKGIKGWLSGKATLSEFAKSLKEFAKEMFGGTDNIITTLSVLDDGDVEVAQRASTVINALVSNLADVKPTTLGKLGTAIKTLGTGLKSFSEDVSNEKFDIQRVSAAISQLSSIAALANDLKTIGDADFSGLIYMLGQLSSEQLEILSTAFSNCMTTATESLTKITDSVKEFVDKFALDKVDIQENSLDIMDSIELMKNKVSSAFGVMSSNLAIMMSNFRTSFTKEEFEKLGSYVTEGIAEGLGSKEDELKDSANHLAELIIETIETRLDEHSPSEEGRRIGRYFDLGIANGMKDGISSIEESGYSAGDAAINSMKDALRRINDLAEDELDTEPVIKPVLDLSNLEGSNRLGTLFTAGIGLSSGFRNAQGVIRSKDINTGGINTAGIDPKQMNELLNETKLMREEIGNFSTELSNMKVVMDSGALVGQIGPGMDIYLGQKAVQMGRSI